MRVINRLPAVKIVNLRHVSKQNVSLAAEDRGQKPRQSWVVHLGPITLRHHKGNIRFMHTHCYQE